MIRTMTLPDRTPVPALGQGAWRMGEDTRRRKQEISALRAGIDLGMTLIDTAEMYGDGATEPLLGEALAAVREQVFLVSKVYPHNGGRVRIERACEASLRRLKTDRLDLYFLHWRGSVPLAETVEGMATLVTTGKIRRWGVSNLDRADMDELFRVGGDDCATNQILYNVTQRGAEFDLLPRLKERHMPTMAYSPIGQGRLPDSPALSTIARRHGVTPYQVALAWVLRDPTVIALQSLTAARCALRTKPETSLDVAPRRRHPGSMNADSKSTTVRRLDRINLRLSGETFAAIDAACGARPGAVSRNTWIAEAVEEKLTRERNALAPRNGDRRAHG